MMPADKHALLNAGITLVQGFCAINSLPIPETFPRRADQWRFDECAYYRNMRIEICVAKCASVGVAGRAWSFPGYTVDRTPYGVMAHELGHHVDRVVGLRKGAYWSEYSDDLRAATGEPKLTNYCPNSAEWFAELFRLFVTNPDLLRILRPKFYAALTEKFRPFYGDSWRDRLQHAPARTFEQAAKMVAKAEKKNAKTELNANRNAAKLNVVFPP